MGNLTWSWLVILIFTGGTIFFSVNSIVLRNFSRLKLHDALEALNKQTLIGKLIANEEKLVLTCALYRLLINICVVLWLIVFFAHRSGGTLRISDYVLTFLITMAIFSVFSVAIPHAWAKYAGEKFLAGTYPVLVLFSYVAWPVLYVFTFYDTFVRRLIGVPAVTAQEQQEKKQEELLSAVEEGKLEGIVDDEEQQMIENVLHFDKTTVDKIMTPRTEIVAVSVNADLQSVLKTIIIAGHSRIPVYEGNIDNIIGLIYAKDLLTEIGANPADFRIRDRLREAYFVPDTKPLRDLLHEFQNNKQHIAIVLDEYGGTAGVVTIEDLLEELVGEIADEYEGKTPENIKKIDENTFEVDAKIYVDDLNEKLNVQLPEDEDYDTIGGFILSHLGYIPKAGETFDYDNVKFVIVAAEARRINRIRVQKITGSKSSIPGKDA